tara:strand:- start:4926 stop:6218 length:1293 start_codon:yes stop_codon:yes gene_type:complete
LKFFFFILLIFSLTSKVNANQSNISLFIKALINNNRYGEIKHHESDILGSGVVSGFRFQQGGFSIVNQMFLSNDSNSTKKGGGKKIKGFYGYTNLGYIQYNTKVGLIENKFIYGRYFIDHGFSKMSDLLISQDSRPMDGALWNIIYRNVEGSMYAIQLEEKNNYKRYLTLHSLKFKINKKLTLLFSESSLYSTDKGGFNWQLLNPVIFWIPERENYPIIQANGLLYFGMHYDIKPDFSLYSEFLIDDYQINKDTKGDLEPNEIGFTLGIDLKNLFQRNINFWAEYTRITNRTYQSHFEQEEYTHRGFPIGHYLGNDFDLFQLNLSKEYTNSKLSPYCNIIYHRNGNNGLDTIFDEPWLNDNVTLESGYSEPFPTRPVVEEIQVEFASDYKISKTSFLNGGIRFKKNQTFENSNIEFIFRISLSIGKTIKY